MPSCVFFALRPLLVAAGCGGVGVARSKVAFSAACNAERLAFCFATLAAVFAGSRTPCFLDCLNRSLVGAGSRAKLAVGRRAHGVGTCALLLLLLLLLLLWLAAALAVDAKR